MANSTLKKSAAVKLTNVENSNTKHVSLNSDEWDDWWAGILASQDDRYKLMGIRDAIFRPTGQRFIAL